ncbi:MAG: Gfo/Idh/MocA family oxidoreductase [Hyphomicrobiales bacterium]
MIKVACVGAGYFSQFHHQAWKRIDGVALVAAVDQNIDAAKETGLAAYSDIKTMVKNHAPNVVDIITPPHTHYELIQECVSAGVDLLICQKPFCRSIEEAERAVNLCEEAGIPLIIHENFRFQPWYRIMKDAMDKGQVGDVHQLTFKLRTGDGQGCEAYLDRQPYFQSMEKFLIHETGVHWVDTFCFLMGKPSSIYADLRRMNDDIKGEDAGYFIMEFDGGKQALFDGNRHLDHASCNCRQTFGECQIEGTKGTLSLDGEGVVRLRAFGAVESTVLYQGPETNDGFAGDCVYTLQQHVVDAFKGAGRFENTGRDYLAILKLVDAIYQSNESGQKVVL